MGGILDLAVIERGVGGEVSAGGIMTWRYSLILVILEHPPPRNFGGTAIPWNRAALG